MADANIRKMDNKRYDSDLTDKEHAILEPLLPQPKRRGRRRSVVLHEILNAIFYILRGGVPWRMLPGGFPPWQTVLMVCSQTTNSASSGTRS
jgi:transposase